MATFVLVHGSMHGGWCWRRVAPLLREAGHVVHTPTLTGRGDRVHLLTARTDLSTPRGRRRAVLVYEDVHEAILVGHSYKAEWSSAAFRRRGRVIGGHRPKRADTPKCLKFGLDWTRSGAATGTCRA